MGIQRQPHFTRQEVGGRTRAAYFQHMRCFVSAVVPVALWPFSSVICCTTGSVKKKKEPSQEKQPGAECTFKHLPLEHYLVVLLQA